LGNMSQVPTTGPSLVTTPFNWPANTTVGGFIHFYLDNLKDGQGVGLGVVLVAAVGGGGAGRSALFAAGMGS
jgi:hypothetical protein